MMRTASEKLAIIRLVEESELSVRRTLEEIKDWLQKAGYGAYPWCAVPLADPGQD